MNAEPKIVLNRTAHCVSSGTRTGRWSKNHSEIIGYEAVSGGGAMEMWSLPHRIHPPDQSGLRDRRGLPRAFALRLGALHPAQPPNSPLISPAFFLPAPESDPDRCRIDDGPRRVPDRKHAVEPFGPARPEDPLAPWCDPEPYVRGLTRRDAGGVDEGESDPPLPCRRVLGQPPGGAHEEIDPVGAWCPEGRCEIAGDGDPAPGAIAG